MKIGAVAFITACALGVGFFFGKKEAEPEYRAPASYLYRDAPDTSSEDQTAEHEAKLDEFRGQLEAAKESAEDARDAAQSAAFEANMKWIKSGRVEDMIRMNDAENAAAKSQDSVDELEDAINNTDR